MKKKLIFTKIFHFVIVFVITVMFINCIFCFSCFRFSSELTDYANTQLELLRIKIYGASSSKEGDTVSGTFSIIDTAGNEIAVIERSWNGSYLAVEFCKINLNGNSFVFPTKIYGKQNIIEDNKEWEKGTSLRKYYTENRQCLLYGFGSTLRQRKTLYFISLMSLKKVSMINSYFTSFYSVDLSECKTNRYYSISCDKHGNMFVSEI